MTRRHAIPPALEPIVRHFPPGSELDWRNFGPGWIGLVRECHDAVVAEFPDYLLGAIKQKEAQLAFQAWPRPCRPRAESPADGWDWTNAELQRLRWVIDPFIQRSESICERCGKHGELRETRLDWDLVLCDACEAQVPYDFLHRVGHLGNYMQAFEATSCR